MSDDLVERVARAICETENGPCKCMPDECGCTYWKAHARAAIALALEEAAKVAGKWQQMYFEDGKVHSSNITEYIVADILALVKEPQ